MKKIAVAIPYNILALGNKKIGADARFWCSLEKGFRKLLLMRLENLLDDVESIRNVDCILKGKIDVYNQLTDLRNLRNSLDEAITNLPVKRNKNPLKLLGLRLATLITPGDRVYKKLENEVNDSDVNEIRSAHFLIRNLDLSNPRPVGYVKYFKIEAEIEGNEIIRILDKIYAGIYKMDNQFKKEFTVDIVKCLNTSLTID
ncbi:MAG: hypothetical protein F7B60_00785 [Desulfurococcales archaeon]|nr:hypothetical protein [Desulfurococcales archaeon]